MKVIKGYGPGPQQNEIIFMENNLGVKFPQEFINCIKQCDQGVPEKDCFKLINPETDKKTSSFIGGFISFNSCKKNNILRTYFTQPIFFPKSLLPFAEVGDGDLICFDYSIGGLEDTNPPVVYWFSHNSVGKEMADIAINFEEFLKKLEPEEE